MKTTGTANQSSVQHVNWRQSSSWLHTWAGLIFGWVLFMVFVTGTLSVFRTELTSWLQPELLHANAATQAKESKNALAFLAQQGAANDWQITLADRSPVTVVRWHKQGERITKGSGQSKALNPESGEVINTKGNRFISFLYRMHFELYNLPRTGARWFIGIATMAMFIALITGIIIHRRIFADFFTFRPRKGQRSWLDMHNLVSVLALPFHLMITFSGLLLIMYMLIPWGISAAYEGDNRAFRQESGGKSGNSAKTIPLLLPESLSFSNALSVPNTPISPNEQDFSNSATPPLLNHHVVISELLAEASKLWPSGTSRIQITNPYGDATYKLTQRGGSSLVNRGRSESLTYKSGKLLWSTTDFQRLNTSRSVYNYLTAWHLMRFAAPFQRWLYFLGGIAGSIMVASGFILWLKRREEKLRGAKTPSNLRWVSVLNQTASMGLLISIVAAFFVNRLYMHLPASDQQVEIVTFFVSWSCSFMFIWYRHWFSHNPQQSWRESLRFLAILSLAIVLHDLIFVVPFVPLDGPSGYITLSIECFMLAVVVCALFSLKYVKGIDNALTNGTLPMKEARP